MSKIAFAAIAAGALSALAISPVFAKGDPAAGEIKANTCIGCHGIPSYQVPYPTRHVPKIGGQHAEYIISALKDYKTGKRKFPTMEAQASSLSEQDIEDIAAYFSQPKPADK